MLFEEAGLHGAEACSYQSPPAAVATQSSQGNEWLATGTAQVSLGFIRHLLFFSKIDLL